MIRSFDALGLFYSLSDDKVWNIQQKIVMFETRASAREFKKHYPEFKVLYRKEKPKCQNFQAAR